MTTNGEDGESVWDYPRPPRLEPVQERLLVRLDDATVAETARGVRCLETSHPPVYYIPPEDVAPGALSPAPGRSFCEFKGRAQYWTVTAGGLTAERAAWSYPDPTPAFRAIAGWLAFYPSRMTECRVGDQVATAQESDFYGGWITPGIRGPFKGPAGTLGW
jgi:uncharacterized protein (DUF427 family)